MLTEALAKYIASFSLRQSQSPQLGEGPPCRNYRNLILFTEYASIDQEIQAATRKEHLKQVSAKWKPFKEALSDLMTQSMVAAQRITKAITKGK